METIYQSEDQNSHVREEENLWSKILATGHQSAGMILIYDQKLCAVAHEIEEILEKITDYKYISYYAKSLKNRINKVIELLDNSGHNFRSKNNFQEIIIALEKLKEDQASYEILRKIPEQIHLISHRLVDELYRLTVKPD